MRYEDSKLLKKMLENDGLRIGIDPNKSKCLCLDEFVDKVLVHFEKNITISHKRQDEYSHIVEFNSYAPSGLKNEFSLKCYLDCDLDNKNNIDTIHTVVEIKESSSSVMSIDVMVKNESDIKGLFEKIDGLLKSSFTDLGKEQMRFLNIVYLDAIKWYISDLLNFNEKIDKDEILKLIDKQIKELENLKNKIKK